MPPSRDSCRGKSFGPTATARIGGGGRLRHRTDFATVKWKADRWWIRAKNHFFPPARNGVSPSSGFLFTRATNLTPQKCRNSFCPSGRNRGWAANILHGKRNGKIFEQAQVLCPHPSP